MTQLLPVFSSTATIINDPEIVAIIQQHFFEYEQALMNNDVEALDQYFWDSPYITRYGIADRQLGIDELRSFRQKTPVPTFTRTLDNLRIVTFGMDTAITQVEFIRSDSQLRGFQTQLWRKMEHDWKIVGAHVSLIDFANNAY